MFSAEVDMAKRVVGLDCTTTYLPLNTPLTSIEFAIVDQADGPDDATLGIP